MQVCLISTYDLGRQPFGLASPAAWLRQAGIKTVTLDLSQEKLSRSCIEQSDWVAFHLPMHTATRLALSCIESVRSWNPRARLICYGLYAPMNAQMLLASGVEGIIGGEFESKLVDLVLGRNPDAQQISLERLAFVKPDRSTLPVLSGYAQLRDGEGAKTVGYTEASRGCKHLCRHCPIVPVYNGTFRVVPHEIVMADVRQQVAAGAAHITFGDPDFLNGPGHALALVEALHTEFPNLTYDVTIKVEHLLRHRVALPILRRTGCSFVVSAVESIDDAVLQRLDKGHTKADFLEVVELVRGHGITLSPTFVTFTPWTTRDNYLDLLHTIRDLDLIENISPIQMAIRLLVPSGSRLLQLEEVKSLVAESFDAQALTYRWKHPDPGMDQLCKELQQLIRALDSKQVPRQEVFRQIWQTAHAESQPPDFHLAARATVPHLTEPWYC